MRRNREHVTTDSLGIAQLLQTAGAAVALVVALVTASWTVYKTLVIDPREKAAMHKQEFLSALSRYGEVIQQMNVQMATAATDQVKAAIQNSAYMPALSALSSAEQAAATPNFTASPAEYNQLSSDELGLSRFEPSANFAKLSIGVGAGGVDAATAHDLLAKAMMQWKGAGYIGEGRAELSKALMSLQGIQSWGVNTQRASIIADWVNMEATMGDCGRSVNLNNKLLLAVKRPDIPPAVGINLITSVSSNPANRCMAAFAASYKVDQPKPVSESQPIEVNRNDDISPKIVSGDHTVVIEDSLEESQNHKRSTIRINGKRIGFISVNKDQPHSSLNVPVKLGDDYSLEGLVSFRNNEGRNEIWNIVGRGHFHGKIVSTYHLASGSHADGVQQEYIDRGPANKTATQY